jgi:hypothetical protein
LIFLDRQELPGRQYCSECGFRAIDSDHYLHGSVVSSSMTWLVSLSFDQTIKESGAFFKRAVCIVSNGDAMQNFRD